MRSQSFALGLLFILCATSAATAQSFEWHDPQTEPWLDQASNGRETLRFGDCAHDDPVRAVRACTQQLQAVQLPSSGSYQSDRAYRYTLRANARAKQGNLSRALSDYRHASKASYGEAYWIHAYRANTYFEAGEYQHALQSYNAAIEIEPDNARLLNARARLLSSAPDGDVRNGQLAIADARVANALEPDNAGFTATLAAAYAEAGTYEGAVEQQRKAIALAPDSAAEAYQDRLNLYLQDRPYRIHPTETQ